MRIKQLGNNGGLGDPTQTNSAFLIDLYDDHSAYLLFDCGYNIMARLIEEEREDKYFEISKIKYLVISNKHDDHCGNMETLIYWNYFKNNVQMNVYVACKGLKKTAKDTRKILNNYKIVKAKTYKTLQKVGQDDSLELPGGISLWFHKTYHGAKPTIGLWIGTDTQYYFISGDTKAHKSMEEYCSAIPFASLVFHDYSNWDDESKNVHACATDFTREYTEAFQERVIKYHTGDKNFNSDWQ